MRTAPSQAAHDRRRARLAEQFTQIVEDMLEGGESYSELSVERLIRAADISRSTFYVYFPDKGELLSAMAERVTAELSDAGAAWFQLPDNGTPEDLRVSLRALFATYQRHRHILGAVSEAAAYDTRLRERHGLLVEAAVTGLREHIEAAQRAGSAAPTLDAHRTAEWLTWMLERGLYQLVGPAATDEREQLLSAVTDLAWRALYAGYRGAP